MYHAGHGHRRDWLTRVVGRCLGDSDTLSDARLRQSRHLCATQPRGPASDAREDGPEAAHLGAGGDRAGREPRAAIRPTPVG